MPLKTGKQDSTPINFKARLEKKLYLAQESPEPVIDVSVCDLKIIPSNIFALCRVLRKDALYLQNNCLESLSSGGSLEDLTNLKVLNISANKFNKLPSNINKLKSLEFLDVSKNQLLELPEAIGDLQNLICLNVSYNNLKQLPNSIGKCKNMEVLKLTYNEDLKQLPVSLGRLHSLVQLEIDSTIIYPPRDICRQGVKEILKFLSNDLKDEVEIPSTSGNLRRLAPNFDDNLQEKIELHEKLKQEKQNELLLLEKELLLQNQKELEMQQKLKDDKKKLLDSIKNLQQSLDAEITKLQEKKNIDHALLIQFCLEEERKSNEVVFKILNLRRSLQMQYSKTWERKRRKEEQMLFSNSTQSRAIERKNILVSMEELMTEEILKAQKVNANKKLLIVRSLAVEVLHQNNCLATLMKQQIKGKAKLLDTLRRDEELQKSAVASLLEKSDEKSWELCQEISIVEAQLAELTRLEVAKRKLEMESQITELSKNRLALTELLMKLLSLQTQRREQLIESIRRMEFVKELSKDSEIFWMQQYDKLLKSKGHEMVKFLEAVDPKLVYELYINGVFHYLPLLKDVALSEDEMKIINVNSLSKCGIKSAEDRSKILRAIKSFLQSQASRQIAPSAPPLEMPSAPLASSSGSERPNSTSYLVPDECVICLERIPNTVFIPCGHICCCYKCFKSITLCPLCRKPISAVHEITG